MTTLWAQSPPRAPQEALTLPYHILILPSLLFQLMGTTGPSFSVFSYPSGCSSLSFSHLSQTPAPLCRSSSTALAPQSPRADQQHRILPGLLLVPWLLRPQQHHGLQCLPSGLWFVRREPHHCLQAWGSAFRSLSSPSLTLHLAPALPRENKAVRKGPLLLPASFTLNMLTSRRILLPFSLVCTTEGSQEPSLSPGPHSVSYLSLWLPPSCSSLRATSVFFQESFSSPERPTSQPDAPLASVESLSPTSHPNVSKTWPTLIFPSSSLLIPQTTAFWLLPPPSAERNVPRPWMTSVCQLDTCPSLLQQTLCLGCIDYSLLLKAPSTSVIIHYHDSLPDFHSFFQKRVYLIPVLCQDTAGIWRLGKQIQSLPSWSVLSSGRDNVTSKQTHI